MKKVLLTPYIFKNKYKKIVLSLNLEWFKYLKDLGFVTNFANPFISIDTQIKHMDMIIISGGGDLNNIKKTNVNLFRDRFEKKIINVAIKKKIPILAICRGFQLVTFLFSKNNKNYLKIKNHRNNNHFIYLSKNNFLTKKKKINVNSYHDRSIKKLNKNFIGIAYSKDKNIEIAYSNKYRILGLMFHPERKNKSQKEINNIIQKFLKVK